MQSISVMHAKNSIYLQNRGVEKIMLESTAQVICYSPKSYAKGVALHAWHPSETGLHRSFWNEHRNAARAALHLLCGKGTAPHQAHDEALPLPVCRGDEHYALALARLVVPAPQSG